MSNIVTAFVDAASTEDLRALDTVYVDALSNAGYDALMRGVGQRYLDGTVDLQTYLHVGALGTPFDDNDAFATEILTKAKTDVQNILNSHQFMLDDRQNIIDKQLTAMEKAVEMRVAIDQAIELFKLKDEQFSLLHDIAQAIVPSTEKLLNGTSLSVEEIMRVLEVLTAYKANKDLVDNGMKVLIEMPMQPGAGNQGVMQSVAN